MGLFGLSRFLAALFIYVSILFSPAVAWSAGRPDIVVVYNSSGTSTSTSNPYEDYIRKGVELASQNVIFVDHGESTAKTLSAIQRINELNPKIVIGMGTSAQAILSGKKLKPGILLITPVATSSEILKNNNNVFLLSNVNSVQADFLIEEIKKDYKSGDRVLVVDVAGCPYCKDFASAVGERLSRSKIAYQMARPHISQIDDFKKDLAEFKDFKIIVVAALESEAAKIISILYPQNKTATFYGGDGWGTLARFIRELPYANQIRAKWLSHYHEAINVPLNVEFVNRYSAKYKTRPIDTAAFYFEATRLSLDLVKEKSFEDIIKKLHSKSTINTLTGLADIRRFHFVRPMPLLSLHDGEVRMEKLIDGKSSHASH